MNNTTGRGDAKRTEPTGLDAKRSERHGSEQDAYRALIDFSHLGYAIIQQGRVMFCNRALAEISGYSHGELKGMSAAEIIDKMHPEDRDRAVATMAARMDGANPPPVQHVRIRHKDGRYLWVETTAARTEYNDGPALAISYMNVDDRMMAVARLEESEAKLSSLIEQNLIGVVLVDQDRRVTEWNPVMEQITGMSRSTVLGQRPGILEKLFSPQGSSSAVGPGMAPGPAADKAPRILECQITSTDGTQKILKVSTFPISLSGRIQFVGMVEDVTAQRRSEETYRVLVENSLEGFAIIQDGRIVFCNPALLRLNGYTLAETCALSPQGVVATVHPDDQPLVIRSMGDLLAGENPAPPQQIRMLNKNGDIRWVEVKAVRTAYNFRPAIQVSYLDITTSHEADSALRESEERFRALIEKAPVAIGISRAGRMIYGNQAYFRLFGLDPEDDIAGRSIGDQIAPQVRGGVLDRAIRRSQGEPAETEFELTGLRKNGTLVPCMAAVTLIDLENGPAAVAFFTDLTNVKEAEQMLKDSQTMLRNLAVHLLSAREEERKKVAREIHDELGQLLTTMKMELRWVEKRLDTFMPVAQQKIHGIVRLADQTIQMVHSISSDLRPGPLDYLGLASAAEWVVADFTRRTGIPCAADVHVQESRIGGNSATAIIRVVQETLTNVARHARAAHASVTIREIDGRLEIAVRDDGIGITKTQSTSFSSFGLIGIRERVQDMGGEVTIEGEQGVGTTVRAVIPLPSQGGLA